MHIHSLSSLSLSPDYHPQASGQLEAQFFHEGTQDSSVMTNVTFPFAYHHTVRMHLHGSVAHRAAAIGKMGRRGWKVVSGSQQLQRTLISLQGLFFPIMIETTNNCAFLLSELVSLMSTSLQKPLQC